jgi:hypothetical protein
MGHHRDAVLRCGLMQDRRFFSIRFMLMFYADESEWMALPEDERTSAVQSIGAWFGQQSQEGHIVEGCRLAGKQQATTVRLGPAGRSRKPMVTDGPFIETKEAMGSYAIVEVADYAAALAIAESWPAGGAVEIRPVVEG